jgi:serine/threonine protein kinase/WD40 repeat protein
MSQLATMSEESLESLVAGLADEFAERLERGERPDPGEFAGRYPEHASVIRQVLSCLNLVRLSTPTANGPGPADGELQGVLGDYRLIREIGRGGMGVVYEAEQVSLRRRVALKVLPFASALDSRHLQRFHNEAHAAAQLHHTNIVPVYAVGCERGVHFYAMQFIDGRSLADFIREMQGNLRPQHVATPGDSDSPASLPKEGGSAPETADRAGTGSTERSARGTAYFQTVSRLGVQAAEALEHAHRFGVIHRDIKPANLLVDQNGNLWVADFGLAQIQGDARLTMTGDLLGTLRYMSPEQALGQREQADHRGDVYSLGVTLYELLTLQPAFGGNDRKQLLRQIAFEEPKPPRKINRSVPAELETIVLKAMAKNATERYATAQELADDLRRFLEDRPITARRPTLFQRTRKWVRRHSAVVTTATVSLVVALAVTASILTVSNLEVRSALGDRTKALDERTTALRKEMEASTAKEEALRKLRAEEQRTRQALMKSAHLLRDRAQAAGEAGDVAQALLLLARAMQIAPADEADVQQSLALYYSAWRPYVHPLRAYLHHGEAVVGVAVSPDGSRWATCSSQGQTLLWDPATCERIGPAGPPRQLIPASFLFSPDSRFLITASAGGFQVHDAKTGAKLHDVGNLGRFIHTVSISPDGNRILLKLMPQKDQPQGYQVWSTETGKQVEAGVLPAFINTPFFDLDGRVCGIGFFQGKPVVWDATKANAKVTSTAYSLYHPNAQVFAIGGVVWTLWHAENMGFRQGARSPVVGEMRDWCFTNDGRYLLGLSSVRLSILPVHDRVPSGAIRFSDPDTTRVFPAAGGNRFLLVGPAGVVVGDAERGSLHDESIRCLWFYRMSTSFSTMPFTALTADGAWLLAESGPTVRVRDASRYGPKRESLQVATATTPLFSPDGRWLLVAETGRGIRFIDRKTCRPTDRVIPLPAEVAAMALRPNSDELLVWTTDEQFTRWNLRTLGQVGGPIPLNYPEIKFLNRESRGVAFSPDGREFLAFGSQWIWIFDVASGERTTAVQGKGTIDWAALSPDGRWIAYSDVERTISFWDRHARKSSDVTLAAGGLVARLDFTADGNRLMCLLKDGSVQTWDVAGKHRIAETRAVGAGTAIGAVARDPSGRLMCAGRDSIMVIDAKTGNQIGPPIKVAGRIHGASIDPEGRTLAVRTPGRIELIELPVGAASDAAQRLLDAQVLTGMSLNDSGTLTTLTADEWLEKRREQERGIESARRK